MGESDGRSSSDQFARHCPSEYAAPKLCRGHSTLPGAAGSNEYLQCDGGHLLARTQWFHQWHCALLEFGRGSSVFSRIRLRIINELLALFLSEKKGEMFTFRIPIHGSVDINKTHCNRRPLSFPVPSLFLSCWTDVKTIPQHVERDENNQNGDQAGDGHRGE